MLTLDETRSAYVARFGKVFEAETIWDKALRKELLVLSFWAGAPPVVYASVGGRSHEVTLISPIPFPELAHLVGEIAHTASVAPFDVIACPIERTPFDGVLLLPPEDGTFVLGHVDGRPRYALRAVPITPAERQSAADAPGKVLDLLRKAGALEANLLRDCVIEPQRTRRFWASNKPVMFMNERQRLNGAIERRRAMLELNAPDELIIKADRILAKRRALLAYLKAPPAGPESPEQRFADQMIKEATASAEIVEHVTGTYGSELPPRVLRATLEILMLVLAIHPEAVRLMALAEGTVGSAKPWSADEALELSADLLVHLRGRLKREKLVACGRMALAGAAQSFDPDRGVPFDSFVWAQMVGAMLTEAGSPSRSKRRTADDTLTRVEAQAIRTAFRGCPEDLMWLEVEPDTSKSPRERLLKIGDDLGSQMLLHLAMAAKPHQTEH